VLDLFVPGTDLDWMSDVAFNLERLAPKRRDKRANLIDPRETYAFGIELMNAAAANAEAPALERAAEFRDGLLFAVLSSRPLRRGDLMRIIIGEHLVASGSGYTIIIRDIEGKTSQHLEFPLPDDLNPYMQCYIEQHRDTLAREAGSAATFETRGTSHLWLTIKGTPFTDDSLHKMIVRRTTGRFGRRQTPQAFRHAAATWVAIETPDQVRITCAILGHAQLRTSERHYNHAHMMKAARQYQKAMAAIRKKGSRRDPKLITQCARKPARAKDRP
jgi:hypothetical protein